MSDRKGFFHRFAVACVRVTGHPLSFGLAVAVILLWAATGPLFRFSDSWQLVVNTATTIVTFLMVFLIQNAQNRDLAAIQLKLAELIRATESAHNAFLDLEELSESELDRLRIRFERLAQQARTEMHAGRSDVGALAAWKKDSPLEPQSSNTGPGEAVVPAGRKDLTVNVGNSPETIQTNLNPTVLCSKPSQLS